MVPRKKNEVRRLGQLPITDKLEVNQLVPLTKRRVYMGMTA